MCILFCIPVREGRWKGLHLTLEAECLDVYCRPKRLQVSWLSQTKLQGSPWPDKLFPLRESYAPLGEQSCCQQLRPQTGLAFISEVHTDQPQMKSICPGSVDPSTGVALSMKADFLAPVPLLSVESRQGYQLWRFSYHLQLWFYFAICVSLNKQRD